MTDQSLLCWNEMIETQKKGHGPFVVIKERLIYYKAEKKTAISASLN